MAYQESSARSLVRAEWHTFELAEDQRPPRIDSRPANGLIYSAPGIAVIMTGINSGEVNVAVEVRAQPPEQVVTEGWDEVIDHSIEAPQGQMIVRAVMDDPPDLPLLTPFGPGHYRVRVHARGRDTEPDGHVLEPCEDYLITVWPSRLEPDAVHRQSDRYGAGLRAAAARKKH